MGGTGCVLAYDGRDIEADFENESSAALDNHGLDGEERDGLLIWEGHMYVSSPSYEYGEVDWYLEGEMRELTSEEWKLLHRSPRHNGPREDSHRHRGFGPHQARRLRFA